MKNSIKMLDGKVEESYQKDFKKEMENREKRKTKNSV